MPLVIGTGIGTPIGLIFLTSVPVAPMQIALGLFVIAVTCLLWIGFTLKSMPGNAVSTAAGLAAGIANGAFGIGGPPVMLLGLLAVITAAKGIIGLVQ